MANDSTNGVLRPGAFSLSWSGGLQYGSREMTFDGVDRFYFAKGDTINDDTQTGVGVFVLRLQNHDLEELKEVARTLCDNDIQTGGPETYDPPSTFNVVCMGDGKVVSTSGSQRLIPEKFWSRVFDAPFRLSEEAWENGQKLIKLDFKTESIERKNGSYIVSVRFINSGERWIKFETPDQWGGDTVRGTLGVAPFSKIGKIEPRDDWGFELAGKKLINQGDFPDGVVLLNPGDSRKLVFSAIPDNKIAKGGYNLSGAAFMRIEYEGNGWGLSTKVDFRPIGNSIAFDHDYPSTPEEREQWERTHRENMSQRPVKPGQTFVEAGLYRAVRTSGAYRGLLLKPFKAGDVATTEPVTMPMDSEYAAGTNISGPVHWVWEASAPTPVKQWSFDIIEDTAQFCEPGVACPRSGRWVPRVMIGSGFGVEEYQYRLAGIVTLRRGETMPSIEGSGPRWEWVGVSNG